jgi:DNA-binding CsgD family transcriptional regulator
VNTRRYRGSTVSVSLTQAVKELGADLDPTFDTFELAMYVVDAERVVRWQNAAATELTGDLRGTRVTGAIAPAFRHRAAKSMARQLLGAEGAVEVESAALRNGRPIRVRVRRVPLRGPDGVVGILGIARPIEDGEPEEAIPPVVLPPRQQETLQLLACGLSTDEIAAELGVATETARNYIRRLLRALGVHSRLEAVVRARQLGLV